MHHPHLTLEDSGQDVPLEAEVMTVGRGPGVDIALLDPSVSVLHAELVRRGPHVYVSDLGLSLNGTRVNGRPVGRRVLHAGDVLSFGSARATIHGLATREDLGPTTGRSGAPELTRREVEVLNALCRPALQHEAFVAPSSAREIADELVVTEAAVKQHLLRLYGKFRIGEGVNRRARLANEVVSSGLVRPVPAPVGDAVARADVSRAV